MARLFFKYIGKRAARSPSIGLHRRPMDVRPTADLSFERIMLAPACPIQVPEALAYENVCEFNVPLATHLVNDIYIGREALASPIELLRLPPAMAFAAEEFMAAVENCWLAEHIPPWVQADAPVPESIQRSLNVESITMETVLLARYGATTWGHWLGELLPKVALVEEAFPGRFCYTVPEVHDRVPFSSFRQALESYGVSSCRVIPLRHGIAYRLTQPWSVSPTWSDHLLHPSAAQAMRARWAAEMRGSATDRRVALLRRPGDARGIRNWDEVGKALQDRGYELIDIANMDFATQVRVFQQSRSVFSVLGSGLTGLIYSPVGVSVLSAAPSTFGDRFFYSLICDRQGRYADLRGQALTPSSTGTDRSSFALEPRRLQDAIAALDRDG